MTIFCQQNESVDGRRIVHRKLCADDELDPACLCGDVCAYHAGDRAFVGNGDCGVTKSGRLLDQFFGVRGAAQEAEVGEAMECGAGRQHGVF